MSSTQKTIERRTVTTELRAAGDKTIEGYAAVFDTPSDGLPFTETIAPGAFARSLNDGADVLALFNHNFDYVLGRRAAGTLDVAEDGRGLHFRVTPPATSWSADLFESIRRGDIRGCSFGFCTPPGGDAWGGGDRRLLDVDLVDVSVVSLPAYTATSVTARQANAAAELRAAVDLLRGGNVDPDVIRSAIADLLTVLPTNDDNVAPVEADRADGDQADDLQARIAVMRRRVGLFVV